VNARHTPRLAGLLMVAVLAAACSSEKSVSEGTAVPADSSTTTSVESTTTTSPAETTVPATAAPTTAATTVPGVPGGWTLIDPATIQAPLAYPCCASNWYGVPSPALPAAGQPLADGAYRIVMEWPADLTQPITATVYRFDQCSVLPGGACEQSDSYFPDELGIDTSMGIPLTITLDASLRVVVGGFTGFTDAPTGFAVGNGADMAELLTALNADYQAAVLDPIAGGASKDDVIASLNATPAYGFGPPAEEFAGVLSYTHGDAPPLLFQYLPGVDDSFEGTTGSAILGIISLEVSGGVLSLQTYAGFYS